MKGTDNERQLFLQSIREEQLSAAIRTSKAWLATQRMLKRTGRTLTTGKNIDTEKKMTFDLDEILNLYLLQLTAGEIKKNSGYSSWIEISQLHGRTPNLPVWFPSNMLVPRTIRRKVDAFRQVAQPSKKSIPEFSGGLYSEICRAVGSKSAGDKLIATFPLTDKDISKVINPDIKVYRSIEKTVAPSYILFMLECKRLGFTQEYEVLSRLTGKIKNTKVLNSLGDSLYFAFLYNESDDLFSLFFTSLKKYINNTQKKEKFITKFIEDIHTRFLFTANKRNYLKRKKTPKLIVTDN